MTPPPSRFPLPGHVGGSEERRGKVSPSWYEVQRFQKSDSEPRGSTTPHRAVVPRGCGRSLRKASEDAGEWAPKYAGLRWGQEPAH